MIKNYSTVAWRNLRKNKIYSFINIIGLAIGMTVGLLIGLWVWDELTTNQSFDNYHRLAEVVSVTTLNGSSEGGEYASVPVGAELKRRFPDEIKEAVVFAQAPLLLAVGDKKIGSRGLWAQQALPSMFSFKMISGSQQALEDPYAMLVSRTTAKALFGNNDPMGKTVRVGDRTDLRVKGVYEDIPDNTNLTGLGFLLAWGNQDNPGVSLDDDWTDHHYGVYVQVRDQVNISQLSARVKDLTKPHIKGQWEELILHPMDRWRLYNRFENGKMVAGRLQSVRLFSIIGLFVLFLACINFMNLSTARSEKRAKEVGIRKAIGSLRGQIIIQFLTESFLFVLLAMVLSLVLARVFLPVFNSLSGKELVMPFGNLYFWLLLIAFTFFTGLIAGSYPAFYLSGFKPIYVLKGIFRSGAAASLPRKALVILQFTVSISLIIGSLIIYRQLQYSRNRPVGYDRAGLITVEINTPGLMTHFDALKADLLRTGFVSDMARSSSSSTELRNSMLGYSWKGKDPSTHPGVSTVFVSAGFGRTVNWKIKEGRDFLPDYKSDSDAFVINEAAASLIGIEHPVNESIQWHGIDHKILGVVNDMVMTSPYSKTEPTFFMLRDRSMHVVSIRINPRAPIRPALAAIGKVFQTYNPSSPFEYDFTDETYAAKFSDEEQLGHLVSLFTMLAIFISCLGLFGLASFVTEQRTKEIGVRKVLGASVFSLWTLLSGEFARLVLVSCGLAIPLSWYLSHRWLEQYAYHMTITVWLFLAAGTGVLLITLLTVSYQTIRASLINPAKSLKTD
ncbi:MAG TPA: ABC transporter permease [Puia sp.]|jgi:ABC-type antimicrobial peptide transport system permease subunit